MTSLDDEIFEIEQYIKSLEINDDTNKEINEMINDGMSKGLIYDFFKSNYRGTIFSNKVIKKEEYDDFQNYINRCQKKDQDKYKKWKQEIINSGIEYSKDELKYNKLNL
jgi:phenylalanyl-tRNA synthetase alpha subunit